MDRENQQDSNSENESDNDSKPCRKEEIVAECSKRECKVAKQPDDISKFKPKEKRDKPKNKYPRGMSLLKIKPILNFGPQKSPPKLAKIANNFNNSNAFAEELFKHDDLTSLELVNCKITDYQGEVLPPISTLTSITFDNCDDNIFKLFTSQTTLKKIIVKNKISTWKGFPHDDFNTICENSQNLDYIGLFGPGTGGYFDCDDFPYKVKSLDTTMLTYHWFAGLKEVPLTFLKSQKGSLEELRIHELPNDFKGGKVLKFILDEMNLKTFYYGEIPLIVDGIKQHITEFSASEVQITSLYEMLKQFSRTEKVTLTINSTDIEIEAIEAIIKAPTDLFRNVKEFEVVDYSRNSLRVFIGLYKHFEGSTKVIIRTNDKNIEKLSKQFKMPNLTFCKITKAADNDGDGAQGNADANIIQGEPDNAPEGGGYGQRGNDEDAMGGNRGGNDGGGDEEDMDEEFQGFPTDSTVLGDIVEHNGVFDLQSSFTNPTLEKAGRLYYYIHSLGFYQIILSYKNVDQLEELIGDDWRDLLCILSNGLGKIEFKFFDEDQDTQENRDRIINKLKKLAFIPKGKNVKLPLITLSRNLMIGVTCHTDDDIPWDRFMKQLSFSNGLSASHWQYVRTSVNENGGYIVEFYVDAKTYADIIRRRLDIIKLAVDPYNADIIALRDREIIN